MNISFVTPESGSTLRALRRNDAANHVRVFRQTYSSPFSCHPPRANTIIVDSTYSRVSQAQSSPRFREPTYSTRAEVSGQSDFPTI